MLQVDLNCDLGEGSPAEPQLMGLVTSASIACGGHAGDADTMRASIRLAVRHGVCIGAHPGYADREQFGRRELKLSKGVIHALISEQVGQLLSLAKSEGAEVRHVKPHGALYNQAARDPELAAIVCRAIVELNPALILFAPAGSQLLRVGSQVGLTVASEVFADRTYQPDGSLTPRSRPEALITNKQAAVRQVLRMVHEGRVQAATGDDVEVRADTVCLHGDAAHAIQFAEAIRRELLSTGVSLIPPKP